MLSILCFSKSCPGFLTFYAIFIEETAYLFLQQLLVFKVDNGRNNVVIEFHCAPDNIRISRYHRAVIAVVVALVVHRLKHNIGHKYKLGDVVVHRRQYIVELLHMRVYELCRETDVVAHHRAKSLLVSMKV